MTTNAGTEGHPGLFSDGCNLIGRVLREGGRRVRVGEGDGRMEAEAGGMLPQPKTARDFRILARSLQRAGSPAHMWTVAPTGPFQGPSSSNGKLIQRGLERSLGEVGSPSLRP